MAEAINKRKQKKSLSKLSKTELLSVMLEQERENEALRAQIAELKELLEEREAVIEDSESLADAALRLSGVFEAADRACEIYRVTLQRKSQ